MADYVDYPQVIQSKIVSRRGTVVERAVSGKPRIRSYWPKTLREFTVVHDITPDEKDDLENYYETQAFNVFTFNWLGDGPPVMYDVRFVAPPVLVPTPGGRYKATVKLIEVS